MPILHKWNLPNHIIPPDSYFIIWADEDGNQGEDHSNFQLSNLGESLILSNSDSSVIDSITYLHQLDDIAFGRSPNGSGSFTMLTPTFKANNDFPNSIDEINKEVIIYHNPKCSKSRQALEIIKSKNIEPTIILYLKKKKGKVK